MVNVFFSASQIRYQMLKPSKILVHVLFWNKSSFTDDQKRNKYNVKNYVALNDQIEIMVCPTIAHSIRFFVFFLKVNSLFLLSEDLFMTFVLYLINMLASYCNLLHILSRIAFFSEEKFFDIMDKPKRIFPINYYVFSLSFKSLFTTVASLGAW